MKRILAFLLTVVLTLFCSVTAFAMELDDDTKQTHVDVYANHVNNTAWNVVSVDVSGNGSTTLSDGTQITVSGAVEPGWQLAIDPITETDANNWISGIFSDMATKLNPFHIYYIDSSGNTMAATGVTVIMKPQSKLAEPVAYSLTSEGQASGLAVTAKDGTFTFSTDGSPYYVLGERVTTPVARNYTVQGTVKRNGQPVEGVTIELHSTPKTDVTDRSGRFSFRDVECGKHSLTAIENGVIVGYVEFILTEGSAANLALSDGIYTVTANQNEIGINLTLKLTENGAAVIEGVFGISATPISPNSPQTGDNSLMWLWIMLMLIAFAGLCVTLCCIRKIRK